MNEQFINDVMDYIKAECPEYYSVTHITNRQYNGKELQGIVIQDTTKPNNTAPILYLDEYYKNQFDAEETAMMIMGDYEAAITSSIPFDVSEIMDFATVKERLFFRLINREYNEEYLQDKIYFDYAQDLAVVFYVDVGYGSILTVTRELYDIWGIDGVELCDWAVKNGKREYPAELVPITEAIINEFSDMQITVMKMQSGNGNLSNEEFKKLMIASQEDDVPMYIWRAGKDFGASVLLYNEEEKVQEQIGKKFYVLPSSVGEVVVLPYMQEYSVSDLKEMVADINNTYLHPAQVLSENVYMVNEQGELLVARENIPQMQQAVAR